MESFEFDGVSGIMRSSNPLDEVGDITKEADDVHEFVNVDSWINMMAHRQDEHIRKIVREELERWEKELESRLRMKMGPAQ